MTVRVSSCGPGDLQAVYEIEKLSFPHPYDLDVFQAYLMRVEEAGFDGFLIAVEGTVVCGYILFEYGRNGLIVSMAVHPESRRKGVGTILLQVALDRMLRRCKEVTLQVGVTNTGAQELYRRHGFVVVGTLKRYYPDGEDAYLMKR